MCELVNETSTSFPRITLSPHSVIPFYDSLWNSGSNIGGGVILNSISPEYLFHRGFF